MNNSLRHMGFSIAVAFIPSIINFGYSLYPFGIRNINILATAIFLISWTVYGFYQGYKSQGHFLSFTFTYWCINMIIVFFHNITEGTSLYILPTFTAMVPMYTLYYFIHSLARPLNFLLLIVSVALIGIMGYVLGAIKLRYDQSKRSISPTKL